MDSAFTFTEPTEHEMAYSIFSDTYKDAYGVRPRHVDPDTMSVEELRAETEELRGVARERYAEECRAEAAAAVEFEATVSKLIACGAGDRETALRWLHEAHGTEGDFDRLAWDCGLPFRYFAPVRKAA